MIQQTLKDDTILIYPGKILDNSNAHEMVEALDEIRNKGFAYVIIDMSELEFLSSAGVGSILGNIEVFRENGGDIIICNTSGDISHVLQVLDLTDYLTIKEDQKEAVAFCGD